MQTQQEQLLTRRYKIDNETFVQNLKHLAGIKEGESNMQMLLRFFKQNGIEIERPATIFWDHVGGLFVRSTEANQNKIEKLVMTIQDNIASSKAH